MLGCGFAVSAWMTAKVSSRWILYDTTPDMSARLYIDFINSDTALLLSSRFHICAISDACAYLWIVLYVLYLELLTLIKMLRFLFIEIFIFRCEFYQKTNYLAH